MSEDKSHDFSFLRDSAQKSARLCESFFLFFSQIEIPQIFAEKGQPFALFTITNHFSTSVFGLLSSDFSLNFYPNYQTVSQNQPSYLFFIK
jgi:hypothetical protein